MPICNPAANGQAHSSPFILVAAMQPLKYGENPIEVFFVKANPIVLNANFIELPA